MPIYLLLVMHLPKRVINKIHQVFAKFFWNNTFGAWNEMCYPKEEEGVGFRSLYDMNKALFAKLW